MMMTDKEKEQEATYLDGYGAGAALYGDVVKAEEEKIAAQEQKYQKAREAVSQAQEERRSVMNAIFGKSKPKYDEQKDKNLRTRAKIQAFGDLLSNVARGVFAYNKKSGAGYVPKAPLNSAFDSVQELNRMKAEYQKQSKEWQNAWDNWRIADADAKVKAAEALATAEASGLEAARKRVQSLQDEGVKATIKGYNDRLDEMGRNTRFAMEEEGRNTRNAATNAARIELEERKNEMKQEGKVNTPVQRAVDYLIANNIDLGEVITESTKEHINRRNEPVTSTTTSKKKRAIKDYSDEELVSLYKRELAKVIKDYLTRNGDGAEDVDGAPLNYLETFYEENKAKIIGNGTTETSDANEK